MGDGEIYGLSPYPNAIRSGGNSGFQALGLTIAGGVSRIILLGYDMRYDGSKSHWHGGHPIKVTDDLYRTMFLKGFETLQTDVEILNASPGSAIKKFKKVRLEDIL
jgi:hypothetical protein